MNGFRLRLDSKHFGLTVDAVLMGCDEAQFRAVLAELMQKLGKPYRDR